MKKVLLTNDAMVNYSGSEIDTLTIANYFLGNNYDVTIFTLEYGYPLLNNIDKRIKLVNANEGDKLEKKYDLIWAHHFPLLDYLLFDRKIAVDYIHYVSLSSYVDYEALPFYYQDLNMVSTLSKEAKDGLEEEGYNANNISLFSNYSLDEDFNNFKKKNTLEKIAIISNHIPNELLDFVELCKNESFDIDIYGIGYKYDKITAKILEKYDLIITIGRTVNQCIALGIPVYVYDRFGGDSFVTKDNIEKSHYYNFSGRGYHRKMSGLEILEDIKNNYSNCVKDLDYCYKYGKKNFDLSVMMDNCIKKLNKTDKFQITKFLEKYKSYIRGNGIFVNKMAEKIGLLSTYSKDLECCQLYFDDGNGFTESNSIKIPYYIKDGIYCIDYTVTNNNERIRIDFLNKELIKIKRIVLNGKVIAYNQLENCIIVDDACYSTNNDPHFEIDGDIKSINLQLEFEYDKGGELFAKIMKERNDLEKRNKQLEETLKSKHKRRIIKSIFRKRK